MSTTKAKKTVQKKKTATGTKSAKTGTKRKTLQAMKKPRKKASTKTSITKKAQKKAPVKKTKAAKTAKTSAKQKKLKAKTVSAKKPLQKSVKTKPTKSAAKMATKKKLTIMDLYNAVHQQQIQQQQNLRNLEHNRSHNFNMRRQYGSGNGMQIKPPRTMSHSRGK